MVDIDNMDLTELTDEQVAKLRDLVDEETYRRHELSSAADTIADVIRRYVAVGGNKEQLAGEVSDALATDA